MNKLTASDEHAWAEAAIPWYLNQTLESQHRRRLESHLKNCNECRTTVESERQLVQAMGSDIAVEYTPHAALKKLNARIDEYETDKKRRHRWRTRLDGARWLTPLALTAQAAAIAILAVTLWSVLPTTSTPDAYRTMSSSSSESHAAADVQIVFAKDVTPERIRDIVANIEGVVAHGPSDGGLFEVALIDDTAKNVSRVVQELRDLPEVVFATARSTGNRQ